MLLGITVFELSSGQTDKQTDRQTNATENITSPISSAEVKMLLKEKTNTCIGMIFF